MPHKQRVTMANNESETLQPALEMLKAQSREASEFVTKTLGIPATHERFQLYLIEVIQVLATNELTLARGKWK